MNIFFLATFFLIVITPPTWANTTEPRLFKELPYTKTQKTTPTKQGTLIKKAPQSKSLTLTKKTTSSTYSLLSSKKLQKKTNVSFSSKNWIQDEKKNRWKIKGKKWIKISTK